MADIKNTQELVRLVVALAGVIQEASVDGKVDIKDLGLLINIFPYVGSAVDGLNEVPEELKDLDSEEFAQISAEISDLVGDLAGEKYGEVTERAIKAGAEIFEIVKILR